jgi:hypothetical protein
MSGMTLFAILMVDRVAQEEVAGASLSASESLLPSSAMGMLVASWAWSASLAMEREMGAAQRVAKGSSKRLEGERAEVMGLGVHSGIIFICAAGHSVTIHFPRKRCLSISTTCVIQMQDRGAKKFGSLKDFDVCGIHKKEL